MDGFDYWVVSFKKSKTGEINDYSKKIAKNTFFRTLIEKAIRKGIITEPVEFKDVFLPA